MYGYIASHNQGQTLVLSDGRVFERRNTEWYLIEKGVDVDAYTTAATEEWDADWTELQDNEISQHIDLNEAASYYIGEPPRNR